MALVSLKAVKVTHINGTGAGFKVTEENESRGKVYKQTYSVWPESHSLKVGDTIDVSGFLGAKIGAPWEDREGNQRTSVELSINSPRIGKPTVQESTPADEPWAASSHNEEVPF